MAPVRELTWKVVDGEALILDIRTGDYFSLSPVATDMWTRLQQGEDAPHIVAAIATNYAVDDATVTGDLAEFVTALRSARLLE